MESNSCPTNTTNQNKQGRASSPKKANCCTGHRLAAAQNSQDELLNQERSSQRHRKRPTKDTTHSKPKYALRRLHPTPPIYEGRHAEHGGVHGEARRQEGS